MVSRRSTSLLLLSSIISAILYRGRIEAFTTTTTSRRIITGNNNVCVHPINRIHYNEGRLDTKLNVEPEIIAGVVATVGAAAWWLSGTEERNNKAKYADWEAKEREYQAEKKRLASIEPRKEWTEEELKQYNGDDETGPLLLAVKGDVFNVWKGRNFYGNGAEYNIMAGRDATRFLAKNRLEEETDGERKVELNIAERANLEVWYWTIKNKYDLVGKLSGYDPKSTEM